MLDPFCGGGAIPLEAQRLGLEAHGGDLNPVAVLISKALVEIPPRFAGLPPVNPGSRDRLESETWERTQGLAEDIGFYGEWMRERAFERIGHLYPTVKLPAEQGGGEARVIAWLWARTVRSPDPSWGGNVPLIKSWILRKKRNKPTVWVEPAVDRSTRTVSYRIRKGGAPPAGTVKRSGGTCLATGVPIRFDYIREQGRQGLLSRQLIAVAAEGQRGRIYLDPTHSPLPDIPEPSWKPAFALPEKALGFRIQQYGMTVWADLFTDRQLVALSTFSDLLGGVRPVVEEHARAAGLAEDGVRLRDGGSSAEAYADAVITNLAFVVDKCADYWSSLCSWHNSGEKMRSTFGRQALPMVWDYAEANPFSGSSGNWLGQAAWVRKAVAAAPAGGSGEVLQRDAASRITEVPSPIVCTDPPYYDNIGYADLSDFFYVWLRRNLSDVWPDECATLLTPKAEELIAHTHRAGSKTAAKQHFEDGMTTVFEQAARVHHPEYPATIFYAYKQKETIQGGTASTGWETFLQGLVDAGLQVTATWPIRTEMPNRPVALGAAALASSVVIACRPRPADAPMATRRELLESLDRRMPHAVRLLQEEAIAPVDMAQSVIGPGMEVFSRYSKVLEADGTPMRVRTALALINEALETALSEEETEFDAYTRWAVTWYDQHGHRPGPAGDALLLATAKNTSLEGAQAAGIAESKGGQVRLLTREEYDLERNPAQQDFTVWEATQQLIARLEHSETRAARLLAQVGLGIGGRARRLAYLLYQTADRRGRTADAAAYNSLVRVWIDLARLASSPPPEEQDLGL